MKMIWSIKQIAVLAVLAVAVSSCKKDDKVVTPPAQAHFLNQSGGTYFVTGPTVSYKVPIGTTTVANEPRTVTISVTSPTGAVQGTHYTLSSTTITIPAGKAIDSSLVIQGIYSQYTTGRKDTLIISIQDQGIAKSDDNSKFTLLMRGPCFDGDVILNDLLGAYNRTNENWDGSLYGPYITTVSAVTPLTATTGKITVTNIFDDGWSPVEFTLDWTDPLNRKVTLVEQVSGGNAGHAFGATYNGVPFKVGPVPASAGGTVGTFSVCGQTITLQMWIGISGVGYYPALYTVSMAR